MLNVDQWCEVLRQYPTAEERALQILKGIKGYGTEYGYYFDEDSENLLNALKAFWILQEHERNHDRQAWNQACDLVINDLLREYYTDGETIRINPKKVLPGK